MSRAASFVLVLVLPVLAACAPHRAPTYSPAELQVDRIAVLDDDGNVIPEELIRATMRPERFRILRPVVGAIAGMTIFAVATMPPGDCSIYDPCSPREKYMYGAGPFVGLLVGGLIGAALPVGKVDRAEAVEKIRAERRAAKARAAQ
jgi:hypothetical protein